MVNGLISPKSVKTNEYMAILLFLTNKGRHEYMTGYEKKLH